MAIHGNSCSKIGIDSDGPEVTPETRTYIPDPKREQECVEFFRKYLPKVHNFLRFWDRFGTGSGARQKLSGKIGFLMGTASGESEQQEIADWFLSAQNSVASRSDCPEGHTSSGEVSLLIAMANVSRGSWCPVTASKIISESCTWQQKGKVHFGVHCPSFYRLEQLSDACNVGLLCTDCF